MTHTFPAGFGHIEVDDSNCIVLVAGDHRFTITDVAKLKNSLDAAVALRDRREEPEGEVTFTPRVTGSTYLHPIEPPIGMGMFRSAADIPGVSFKPSTQVSGTVETTIDRETINRAIARFRKARVGGDLSIQERRALMDEAIFFATLFTPGTYRVPDPIGFNPPDGQPTELSGRNDNPPDGAWS